MSSILGSFKRYLRLFSRRLARIYAFKVTNVHPFTFNTFIRFLICYSYLAKSSRQHGGQDHDMFGTREWILVITDVTYKYRFCKCEWMKYQIQAAYRASLMSHNSGRKKRHSLERRLVYAINDHMRGRFLSCIVSS